MLVWITTGMKFFRIVFFVVTAIGALAQDPTLSQEQIRDAFREAHFPDSEVEAFSRVVETRIADLKKI